MRAVLVILPRVEGVERYLMHTGDFMLYRGFWSSVQYLGAALLYGRATEPEGV